MVTDPKRLTLVIVDPTHSTTPQYLAQLAEELERILAARGLQLETLEETLAHGKTQEVP